MSYLKSNTYTTLIGNYDKSCIRSFIFIMWSQAKTYELWALLKIKEWSCTLHRYSVEERHETEHKYTVCSPMESFYFCCAIFNLTDIEWLEWTILEFFLSRNLTTSSLAERENIKQLKSCLSSRKMSSSTYYYNFQNRFCRRLSTKRTHTILDTQDLWNWRITLLSQRRENISRKNYINTSHLRI